MSKLTRRSFVAGATAIPFAVWLANCGGYGNGDGGDGDGGNGDGGNGDTPQPQGKVRYDARSPQGQAMLAVYAQAVGQMQTAIAEGSPTSWVFQWYTHNVRGDRTKAGELNRIYPSPSPDRDLANEMWNTCQAHGKPVEDYFLPWHRMYVYFFETIIRQVSGNADFTLPYWNYSTQDMAVRGVIPPEFGQSGSALFVDKRNAGVNAGQPIQGSNQGALSLSSLAECTYSPSGAAAGFNQALDFGLHGNIHVLTGNGQNMGSVPWAAGDPVFWAHHGQIDRLWASWSAGGRANPTDPTWLDKTFVFADANGQKVVAKISDFVDIATLGYSYDALEPVPPCPEAEAFAEAEPQVRAAADDVQLGTRPVRLPLRDGGGAAAFAEEVPEGLRTYVKIEDLAAQAQPGVVYNVYLGLPEGADPAESDRHLVGTINFFGAVPHGDEGHGAHAEAMAERFVSFDVTEVARQLGDDAAPSVTIAPVGQPAAEARPVLGRVSLVDQ